MSHTKLLLHVRYSGIGEKDKKTLARDVKFSCIFTGNPFTITHTQAIFLKY